MQTGFMLRRVAGSTTQNRAQQAAVPAAKPDAQCNHGDALHQRSSERLSRRLASRRVVSRRNGDSSSRRRNVVLSCPWRDCGETAQHEPGSLATRLDVLPCMAAYERSESGRVASSGRLAAAAAAAAAAGGVTHDALLDQRLDISVARVVSDAVAQAPGPPAHQAASLQAQGDRGGPPHCHLSASSILLQ